MAKIATILGKWFEDVEYTKPVQSFKKNGHEVMTIGINEGKVMGKKKNTEVKIDKTFEEADVEDFDALLIPGGYSPDNLRSHEEAVEFVKKFMDSGKPIFSICHGPQILITAQVLKDRKITGWKSIVQDIKNSGAKFVDKEVVIDGNLVSSRHPGDLPAFINASLKKLEEK